MAQRDTDFFIRGGTPRLRQFLEEHAADFSSRAVAAENIKLTPAELSNFTSGVRAPSPQKVLNIVSNLSKPNDPHPDFPGCLDQILIESGHAPAFFRHLASGEGEMLLLSKLGDFYSIETVPISEELLSVFSDLRFAGRKGAPKFARIVGEESGRYLAMEVANDDTDLADGDVAFCIWKSNYCFARMHREGGRAKFKLIDPVLLPEPDSNTHRPKLMEGEVAVLARVMVQFFPLCLPTATHSRREPVGSIRSLDKLRVGVAPFQDSLLTMVGVELGFFEEEGLLVRPERAPWYEWPDFLHKGQDEIPCIVFSNIFTFVEKFTYTHDVRFLFGLNLFRNGFKLIEKPEKPGEPRVSAELRIFGDEEATIEVATIGNSDWAAQLFSLCRARKINLAYESARGITPIFPEKKPFSGRPTIVILDTTRQAGVENNPASIDHNYSLYLGSIPQRMSLVNQYGWRVLDKFDLGGPFPVNGFVGSSKMLTDHLDIFLRFLRAWFRIVNYIRPELELQEVMANQLRADAQTGSRIVERAFEDDLFPDQIAKLKIFPNARPPRNEIVDAWSEELFPRNPYEIEREILGTRENSPWRQDAVRAMDYIKAFSLLDQKRTAKWFPLIQQLDSTAAPSEDDPFALEFVHREYVARYGTGEYGRTTDQLKERPLPELLSNLKR